MKKIVALLLVIVMAAACAFSVFADTQSEKERLIKAIEEYEITLSGGAKVTFKPEDINAAKNFLDAYDGEVTPAMVDRAIEQMDAVADVVKRANVSDLKKLSKAQRQSAIEKADAAVEDFGLDVSFNTTSNKVEFTDSETGALEHDTSSALKKTGVTSPVYVVAGFVVIALIGCAVLTKKYALSK